MICVIGNILVLHHFTSNHFFELFSTRLGFFYLFYKELQDCLEHIFDSIGV